MFNPPLIARSKNLYFGFFSLIASLCGMPNAAMAGCSRCPVAWEAVQRLYVVCQEGSPEKGRRRGCFWRVVPRCSSLVAPKCEMFNAYAVTHSIFPVIRLTDR